MKKMIAVLLVLCMVLSFSGCGLSFGSHEVRFELNGGTLVSGDLLQKVKNGGSAKAPEVERDGYELTGWSEDIDDVREDIVAVAQWAKLYTVTFDPNGGELVSGKLEQRVAKNKFPKEPVVEHKHAEFAGWTPEVSETIEDITYVARWSLVAMSSEEIYELIGPAVVEIKVYDINGYQFALGSGFFIDNAGTLVTNYHVIESAYSAKAMLYDGSTVDIKFVKAYDEGLDLAILQADISDNRYLELAKEPVKTGETVYALGSSQGLTGSFSEGIVSTASRDIEGVTFIQTTAPISQGNSGGPLVNSYGEVVGVNSLTMTSGQNLNFAIVIGELEKLDASLSLSMSEFYDLTAPPPVSSVSTNNPWAQSADAWEVESNDTIMLSDPINKDQWLAGEISTKDDVDCFYLILDKETKITFMAAPYYKDDMSYFRGTVFLLGDEDLEEVADLSSFDAGAGNFMYGVNFGYAVELRLQPGTYFLALYLEDSYWNVWDEPSYYLMRTTW